MGFDVGLPHRVCARELTLKIPTTFRALVLLLATSVVGYSAPAEAQSNLIVNGDAETDLGGDGFTVVPPTGWTDTNGATVVLYGSFGGFPDANSTGPTNRGNNFFAGGPNPGGCRRRASPRRSTCPPTPPRSTAGRSRSRSADFSGGICLRTTT